MNSAMPFFSKSSQSGCLNVVLAYHNMAAALWGAELLTSLFRKHSATLKFNLSPVSFWLLGRPEWRGLAVADTARADLIVLTTASLQKHLPPVVEDWLKLALAQGQRDHRRPAVISFFRRGELHDNQDSPRLQAVQSLVRDNGCEFFAPYVTHPETTTTAKAGPRRPSQATPGTRDLRIAVPA